MSLEIKVIMLDE